MDRKITNKVAGYQAVDGAGVNLVRVLGMGTMDEYDPILMMDSFDSTNPDDYTAGFPMHPHRGIETITYLAKGTIIHRDSLGHEETMKDGEIQWMNSGYGIMHEEILPPSDRLLGTQFWLNLPATDKMVKPTYKNITLEEIEEIEIDGGVLRLLAGRFKGHEGYQGAHVKINFYDIELSEGKEVALDVDEADNVLVFTLIGDAYVAGEFTKEKTAVKMSDGDTVRIAGAAGGSKVIFLSAKPLGEPRAWAGPIVMNTEEELQEAFAELRNGTFVK